MTKSEGIVADFEFDYTENNVCHASRPDLAISVLGEGGKVFHRRAIRITNEGVQEPVSMLVARLPYGVDENGKELFVSLYYQEGSLILSKEDIYL